MTHILYRIVKFTILVVRVINSDTPRVFNRNHSLKWKDSNVMFLFTNIRFHIKITCFFFKNLYICFQYLLFDHPKFKDWSVNIIMFLYENNDKK